MRIASVPVVVLATVLLAGCGAGGGGSTPESTFHLYKAAMSDRNFEDAWNLLTPAAQERTNEDAAVMRERVKKAEGPGRVALEDTAKLIGMTLDDMKKMDGRTYFIAVMKMAAETGREEWERLSRAEIAEVKVNGDRAQVFIKSDGQVQADHPLPLLKDGGRWKIDLTASAVMLQPAPAPAPDAPKGTP